MTRRRRHVLAGSGVALSGLLAGCLGFITGEEPLEVTASPGSVSEAALSETGYAEHEIDSLGVEETFEVGDRSRTVRVTNWHSQYDRALDLGSDVGERFQGAVFSVLSTPKVEILGRSLNPIDEWGTDRIVEMIQDRYEGVEDLQQVDEYTSTVLGAAVSVTEYDGTAEIAGSGEGIDLRFHVTDAIDHGDDFVLCLAVYPTIVPGEDEAVGTLLNGVEHDG